MGETRIIKSLIKPLWHINAKGVLVIIIHKSQKNHEKRGDEE